MTELREKKIKLRKKCEVTLNVAKESENYEELLKVKQEIVEENKGLLEELSQLTADLEIKELKIKNLQKKIDEMTAIFKCESETDTDAKEIKFRISQQQEVINNLKHQLNTEENSKEDISTKPCSVCLII